MILKKCEEINIKIKSLKEQRKIAEEFQAYRTREEDLSNIVVKATQPVKTIKVFSKKNVGHFEVAVVVPAIREHLRQIESDFLQDPSTILKRSKLSGLLEELDELWGDMQRQFVEKWEKYKADRIITVNEELLLVLQKIPGFTSKVNMIRAKNREIVSIHQDYPTSTDEVDAFLTRAEALRTAWDALGSESIPDTVWSFLKEAVSHTGASLESVTPDVVEWLRENQVKSSFRVKITSEI